MVAEGKEFVEQGAGVAESERAGAGMKGGKGQAGGVEEISSVIDTCRSTRLQDATLSRLTFDQVPSLDYLNLAQAFAPSLFRCRKQSQVRTRAVILAHEDSDSISSLVGCRSRL